MNYAESFRLIGDAFYQNYFCWVPEQWLHSSHVSGILKMIKLLHDLTNTQYVPMIDWQNDMIQTRDLSLQYCLNSGKKLAPHRPDIMASKTLYVQVISSGSKLSSWGS